MSPTYSSRSSTAHRGGPPSGCACGTTASSAGTPLPSALTLSSTHPSRSAFDLFRAPTLTRAELLPALPALAAVDAATWERVRIAGLYHPQLERQDADVAAFRRYEHLVLSPHTDYAAVAGLSFEVRERLAKVRPASIVSRLSLSGGACGC